MASHLPPREVAPPLTVRDELRNGARAARAHGAKDTVGRQPPRTLARVPGHQAGGWCFGHAIWVRIVQRDGFARETGRLSAREAVVKGGVVAPLA
jgi:hypothetical protein